MEIEAKFRVDNPALFITLQACERIGDFVLTAGTHEQQHNTYFDTTDWQLQHHGYALRIRDLGTHRIATLKGAGHVQDGLHERDEWEQPIGDADQPRSWPAGAVRERVMHVLADQELQPILQIATARQHLIASLNSMALAELSLDEGVIRTDQDQ